MCARPVAAGVAALAFLAALAAGTPASAGPALDTPAARAAHLAALPALAGRPAMASDLRGRALLVVFFASWCPGCNDAFEQTRLAHLAHAANGLAVVAVNFGEDARGAPEIREKRLADFLARHEPVFAVVRGSAETAAAFGGVVSLPTLLVFDRDGRQRFRFAATDAPGDATPGYDAIEGAIRNALGTGAAALPPASLPGLRESVINVQHFNRLASAAD
jgi:thiol-disulfide isomerase/thioredoxin